MTDERKTPPAGARAVDVVEAELRQRTAERDEAVAREAAMTQVLQIINSSPGDVAPAFDAILERATHLCEAVFGNLYLFEGGTFLPVAVHGAPEFGAWFTGRGAIVPPPGAPLDRILRGEDVAHIPDATDTEAYRTQPRHREVIDRAGIRTWIGVALRARDGLLGGIIAYRQEVRPFTEKQIALLQGFAAQAVIAIENARLFHEVQAKTKGLAESLQQQTATADVLKVISRSAFDLQAVLDTLVTSAAQLCGADGGLIWLRKDDLFHAAAAVGYSLREMAFFRDHPRSIHDKSLAPRVLRSRRTVHIPDRLLDPEFGFPGMAALPSSLLGVPLLRDDRVEGVFTLSRSKVAPFTPRQIELVETFADQSVIAIENARLFDQVQERTRELSRSLDDLRTAQDRLVQTEKLASLGQLTAGIAHEIKNPLNFVNNFSALSTELIDEMTDVLKGAALDQKPRQELEELAQLLKSNLEKVVQHGKRADSIVKNMLLHSREGSGEYRSVDINALVEESLSLAWHGARAEKTGFTVALKRDLDPDAGAVELYPQEITRALLNLISNGFYAATQRRSAEGESFEPALTVATKGCGTTVEIRIHDNGTGIPEEVKGKIFNPFFTTKPSGEGTGLGLSMSHDIIVKQHGGSMDVETEPGRFTEFRIVLPRTNQR